LFLKNNFFLKDAVCENEEIVKLVKELTDAVSMIPEDRYQKLFRLHTLMVSTEGETFIEQLIQESFNLQKWN
jgi:hypothetical protein